MGYLKDVRLLCWTIPYEHSCLLSNELQLNLIRKYKTYIESFYFRMGPLFVLLEVMFFFGYRQEFQYKIWKKVEKEIAKFKTMKQIKCKN